MFNIDNFYAYREDNRMEVKKAKDGLPVSLWDTYSAFANCYGGVIILGVKENKDGSWVATGLKDDAKIRKQFWDVINNRNKVSVNLLTDKDLETYNQGDNIIIAIHVPKARREQKPVYINDDIFNGTFRRNWEGDYHCTQSEVLGMLRDQPEETSDMKVLDDFIIDDLDTETIRGYRNRHIAYKPGHPWEKLNNKEYLEKLGAAAVSKNDGELHPTAAGLLMFGEEYKIVREFPEYFLDYREILDPTIRWTDRLQSSSGDWSGNLFDFYFRVYNKLIKDIKVPFKMEGGNRIDDTAVHKALREALANCLINTDYYSGRGIVIKKEIDMIVMENPGGIRTGKRQMLKGGISDPRNKALMKMFNMINIGERAGSGVPDIFMVWENQGWAPPIVDEQYDPDRTILRLDFTEQAAIKSGDKKAAIKSGDKKAAIKSGDKKAAIKVSKKTQAQYDKILAFMKRDQEYRLEDFCELLNLKKTRTKDLLQSLVLDKQIEAIGGNRDRRYRISK